MTLSQNSAIQQKENISQAGVIMSLSDIFYDFLDEYEFTINDTRLGDFLDKPNEAENSRIITITNNDTGFSYNFLMPYHTQDGPELSEICLWMAAVYDEMKDEIMKHGKVLDNTSPKALIYDNIYASGINSIVVSFKDIAIQD